MNVVEQMVALLGSDLLGYGNTSEDGDFVFQLRNGTIIWGPHRNEDEDLCFGVERGTHMVGVVHSPAAVLELLRRADPTVLLTDRQAVVFAREKQVFMVREIKPDFYNAIWFCAGEGADWTGFQDDYGTFIPVDWC